MRDENQCLHGRDAHAPLAFASHTLSSHFRISDTQKGKDKCVAQGGQPERSEASPRAIAHCLTQFERTLYQIAQNQPLFSRLKKKLLQLAFSASGDRFYTKIRC